MPTAKRPRVIHGIQHHKDRAENDHGHLWHQGRHPRIHERQVRAEGVVLLVYVVVADAEGKPASPKKPSARKLGPDGRTLQ